MILASQFRLFQIFHLIELQKQVVIVLSNIQTTFVYTWSYKDQNIEEYVEIMNLMNVEILNNFEIFIVIAYFTNMAVDPTLVRYMSYVALTRLKQLSLYK